MMRLCKTTRAFMKSVSRKLGGHCHFLPACWGVCHYVGFRSLDVFPSLHECVAFDEDVSYLLELMAVR